MLGLRLDGMASDSGSETSSVRIGEAQPSLLEYAEPDARVMGGEMVALGD